MVKRSVDRRDFLKGAAVTGAAALVPGSVAAESPQAAPPAQAPATVPTPSRETDPSGDAEVATIERLVRLQRKVAMLAEALDARAIDLA